MKRVIFQIIKARHSVNGSPVDERFDAVCEEGEGGGSVMELRNKLRYLTVFDTADCIYGRFPLPFVQNDIVPP